MSDSSVWRNSIVMAPRDGPIKPTQGRLSTPHTVIEPLPADRDYLEGLIDKPLQTIDIPDDSEQKDVHISDCSYIGSYNWVKEDSGTPAILVPGSPPHWQNRHLPYTLPPDRGLSICDQNGCKMPKAVLLPLIVAVNKRFEMAKQPAFNWPDIDVVTDRNNLRKLMRWTSGNTEDFRIDLQLAGKKTLLMNRFSQRYKTVFSGRTYGFSFEKCSTLPAPGCKNSSGHHRIITYDLNGIKMVVRFEVDACTRPPAKYPRRSTASVDELAESLSAISLTPQSAFRSEYPLLVREGGVEVPFDTVIEIVTRSEANLLRGYDWREVYPQLFFSQTAQHYLAVHKHGKFFQIMKKKTKEMQDIEQSLQTGFKKVRKVLDVVRELAIKHGKEGGLSLVCKDGVLKVYERESKESLLPDVAMKFFESG